MNSFGEKIYISIQMKIRLNSSRKLDKILIIRNIGILDAIKCDNQIINVVFRTVSHNTGFGWFNRHKIMNGKLLDR